MSKNTRLSYTIFSVDDIVEYSKRVKYDVNPRTVQIWLKSYQKANDPRIISKRPYQFTRDLYNEIITNRINAKVGGQEEVDKLMKEEYKRAKEEFDKFIDFQERLGIVYVADTEPSEDDIAVAEYLNKPNERNILTYEEVEQEEEDYAIKHTYPMVAIQIMLEALLNEHGLYFDKKKLQSDLILIRKWKSFAKPGDVRDKETILAFKNLETGNLHYDEYVSKFGRDTKEKKNDDAPKVVPKPSTPNSIFKK